MAVTTSSTTKNHKPEPKIGRWLSPTLYLATPGTIIIGAEAARGRIPQAVFALCLAATCIVWIGAIAYWAVRCITKHANRNAKRVVAEIRETRIRLLARELGADPADKLRAVR